MNIDSINKVFFIGIGGIGMSGLAKYFLQKNIRVSGYDREKSHVTKELNKLGANIIYDSNKLIISEFIDDKKDTLIVYTPAISKSDPILEAFLKNDFKVYKRSEILEIAQVFRAHVVDLSDESIIIEVTGDPGKTAAIEKLLSKFSIHEIARTGKVSLIRGSMVSTNYLKVR